MTCVKQLFKFLIFSCIAYVMLRTAFWMFCQLIGHNSMEHMYLGASAVLLSLVIGLQLTWLLTRPPFQKR